MKFSFYIMVVILICTSCSKEKTLSEELVGDWLYERETFNSFSTLEDPDTQGYISFKEDETGNWNPSDGLFSFMLEWDLQADDTKISITKYPIGFQNIFPLNTVYDLTREDEDSFTFTFHFKSEVFSDTIDVFEQFENIILTRME